MNFEIPKNVARGTTKGPPSIIDLLQQMNEQLASVNTAVKQSPLETAQAVKEALKPAKPSMPNRKLFETAVGTNIVDREVGFLGRTLVVNNGTNQWWYLKILGAWVQPYQTGLILPVPDGFQTLSLLQQAPTGVSQSGQISGQTITLTVDSREFLATPGVVPSGSGGGRIIVAAQPLVRPANTTPYVAGQVVSNSTSATTPIAFPVARAGGGSGYIVKARLVIQGTPATFNALTFWLWLYTLSTVTVAVDGAGMTSLWTNRASKVDVIPFYATAYEAGSGSDSVYSIRDDLRIPFVCAGADTNLYGVLETKTGFTPTSAQNFFIELTSDQN